MHHLLKKKFNQMCGAVESSLLEFQWLSFSTKYFVFMIYNRKFDQDLESVSSGLRRLKHLSKAFDDIIGRDNR